MSEEVVKKGIKERIESVLVPIEQKIIASIETKGNDGNKSLSIGKIVFMGFDEEGDMFRALPEFIKLNPDKDIPELISFSKLDDILAGRIISIDEKEKTLIYRTENGQEYKASFSGTADMISDIID